MILRALTLAGGVLGGALASQFPEYAQQYAQRLGGAVNALTEVVADFDASAAAEGLTREAALAQMTGSAFVERRQADMRRTFARHARLSEDLAVLQSAGPFLRAYHASRMTDRDVAQATYRAFVPAVPLSLTGAVFALGGLLLGIGVMRLGARLCLWPVKRLRRAT